jgi:ankyrin repeat protein
MIRAFLLAFLLSLFSVSHAADHNDRMHAAVEKNDVAKVRTLLSLKTNPNQRKDTRASPTFLTQAARLGHVEIVSLLIASGADVNSLDGDAMTPLMHASWNGHLKVVELLLNSGALVNEEAKWGDTALAFAKQKKHTEVVAVLIKAGAK